MRKFTVFTVLLTVIIVVIVADLFINDYLPRLTNANVPGVTDDLTLPLPDSLNVQTEYQANVLGSDIEYENITDDYDFSDLEYQELDMSTIDETALDAATDITDTIDSNYLLGTNFNTDDNLIVPIPEYPNSAPNISGASDFEDENFTSFTQNVLIREDQIKSAGFVGAYLEKEPHNGYLYKTIYIDDLYDVELTKYSIRTKTTLFAKVYIFQMGHMSGVDEVYEVLKVRGSEGLDIEINETNDYGDGSFYLNDTRRVNVAFLTVKFGNLIYGFSYPKEYHSQVKNLIKLIDMEF